MVLLPGLDLTTYVVTVASSVPESVVGSGDAQRTAVSQSDAGCSRGQVVRSGEIDIAFQQFGVGDRDIVVMPAWISRSRRPVKCRMPRSGVLCAGCD